MTWVMLLLLIYNLHSVKLRIFFLDSYILPSLVVFMHYWFTISCQRKPSLIVMLMQNMIQQLILHYIFCDRSLILLLFHVHYLCVTCSPKWLGYRTGPLGHFIAIMFSSVLTNVDQLLRLNCPSHVQWFQSCPQPLTIFLYVF